MTHTLLHNGAPIGTIDLKCRNDRGTGVLHRDGTTPPIVQEMFDAWATVEQPGDLPKWQGGQDTATSPSAARAFQRVQEICNQFALRDEDGKDVPFESVHAVGYYTMMVVFFTFGTTGNPVPARLRQPLREEPGYSTGADHS
jgi:hypothetical protein